jgi:hypothetical protein
VWRTSATFAPQHRATRPHLPHYINISFAARSPLVPALDLPRNSSTPHSPFRPIAPSASPHSQGVPSFRHARNPALPSSPDRSNWSGFRASHASSQLSATAHTTHDTRYTTHSTSRLAFCLRRNRRHSPPSLSISTIFSRLTRLLP